MKYENLWILDFLVILVSGGLEIVWIDLKKK